MKILRREPELKQILVVVAHGSLEHIPRAFLAFEEREQHVWEDRLRQSDWPTFDVHSGDPALTEGIGEWSEKVAEMCAVSFGHGMENVARQNEVIPTCHIPLLRWNADGENIDVVYCMDYVMREIELCHNVALLVLLRAMEKQGTRALHLVGC